MLDAKKDADLTWAVQCLQAGGIGALPTETVYGLAGDACREGVVGKIFAAKERPLTDPLIVHVGSFAEAQRIGKMTPLARNLAQHFWPGPLTLILPKQSLVPSLVTAGKPTVAVRMPSHPVIQQILREGRLALAAPSANCFGRISPTLPNHVQKDLKGRIDFILDGGPTGWGLESTVLDLSEEPLWKIYRPGPITLEELETWARKFAPATRVETKSAVLDAGKAQSSPGLLERHYSPETPLKLISDGEINGLAEALENGKPGLLLWTGLGGAEMDSKSGRIFCLSPDGTLQTAAQNLYSVLHEMDQLGAPVIYVQRFPRSGLGLALNNRLERAASP
mgnify:FL=1